MWWLIWIVIMVLVPCLDGLHVVWQMRAPAAERAEAEGSHSGSSR